jgi:hypothetical protein
MANPENNESDLGGFIKRSFVYIYAVAGTFICIGFLFLLSDKILPSYAQTTTPYLRDLGSSLIAVGLVSLVVELVLRKHFVDVLHQTLSEKLHDELAKLHDELLNRLERRLSDSLVHRVFQARQVRDLAGVTDVSEKLSVESLSEQISQAHNIRIMQTWIPFLYEIVPSISRALADHRKVELLLLNPESNLAVRRSKAMGYSNLEQVSDYIVANLKEIKFNIVDDTTVDSKTLEVRLYDTLPIACIYQLDARIIFSLFLEKQRAHQTPHFVIAQQNTWLYTALKSYMDAVWNEATVFGFEDLSVAAPEIAPK